MTVITIISIVVWMNGQIIIITTIDARVIIVITNARMNLVVNIVDVTGSIV